MRVFERVCVECPKRSKFPKCPRYDCARLFETLDDEAALLDVQDERARAMFEGFETWKEKRCRSDWLKGGFALFAYEDDEYIDVIRTAYEGRRMTRKNLNELSGVAAYHVKTF